MKSKPRPPVWPTWLIAFVGVVLTLLVLAWLGSIYDTHGNKILDDALVKIIVSGIGAAATVGAIFAQRALTQLHPNHGSSLADAVARLEGAVAGVARDVGGIRSDIRRQDRRADQQEQRITDLDSQVDELRLAAERHHPTKEQP